MTKAPPSVRAGRTRCLAPGKEDHWFNSPDKVLVRICPKCRERVSEGKRNHRRDR